MAQNKGQKLILFGTFGDLHWSLGDLCCIWDTDRVIRKVLDGYSRSAFPGSEIVGSAKIKLEETCPLFAYHSLSRLPSMRPGSALGEKGEKNRRG